MLSPEFSKSRTVEAGDRTEITGVEIEIILRAHRQPRTDGERAEVEGAQ